MLAVLQVEARGPSPSAESSCLASIALSSTSLIGVRISLCTGVMGGAAKTALGARRPSTRAAVLMKDLMMNERKGLGRIKQMKAYEAIYTCPCMMGSPDVLVRDGDCKMIESSVVDNIYRK